MRIFTVVLFCTVIACSPGGRDYTAPLQRAETAVEEARRAGVPASAQADLNRAEHKASWAREAVNRRQLEAGRRFAEQALVDAQLAAARAKVKKSEQELALAQSAFKVQAAPAASQLMPEPDVRAFAPSALDAAQEAAARAARQERQKSDSAERAHLQYLAGRRMELARLEAENQAAERETRRLQALRSSAAAPLPIERSGRRSSAPEYARAALLTYSPAAEKEYQELSSRLARLQPARSARGIVCTINDALFEPDSDELKKDTPALLVPLAEFLRRNAQRSAVIEGHSDASGPSNEDRDLALSRAEKVKAVFIAAGIEPHRLEAVGLGADFPRSAGADSASRAQNRRVEVTLQGPQ